MGHLGTWAAHLARSEFGVLSRNHLEEAGPVYPSTFLPSSFSDSTNQSDPVVGKSIATMLIPKADRKAIHEV